MERLAFVFNKKLNVLTIHTSDETLEVRCFVQNAENTESTAVTGKEKLKRLIKMLVKEL